MARLKRLLLLLILTVPIQVWADGFVPRNAVPVPDSISTIWVLGDLEPVARALTWCAMLFNSNTGSFAVGVMQVSLIFAAMMATINVAYTGQLMAYRNFFGIIIFAVTLGPSMSVRVANSYDSGLDNAGAVRFKQVDNVPLAIGLLMGTFSSLSNKTTQKINTVTQSVPDTALSSIGAEDMGTLAGGVSLYGSRGMHSPLRVLVELRKAFANGGDPLIAANMGRAGNDCHQWRTRWNETREKGFMGLLTDPKQAGETSIWVPGSDGNRILTRMNCADAGKIITAQSMAQVTPKPGQNTSAAANSIAMTQATNINQPNAAGKTSAEQVQGELSQLPAAISSAAGGGTSLSGDNPHNALEFAYKRASEQGGRFNPNEMAQFYSAAIQVDAATIQSSLMMNRLAERCLGMQDNSCNKTEQIMGEAFSSSAVDAAGEATGWANTYEKFFNFMLAFFIMFTVLMVPVVMIKGVKSFMILGAYIGMAAWLFMIPPVQAGVGHFMQSSLTDKLYAIAIETVAGGHVQRLLSPEFSSRVFDEVNKTILTGSTIMSSVSALALFLVLGSAYVFNGIATRAAMVGTGSIDENVESPRLDKSKVIDADKMIDQSSLGGPLADFSRLLSNTQAGSGHSINLSSSQAMTEAAKASVSRQLSMVDAHSKTLTWAHVDSNGIATSDGYTLNRGMDGSLSLNYSQKGDRVLKDGEQYAIGVNARGGVRGKLELEVLGTGGGVYGDASIDASKRGTADNSVSYTDAEGREQRMTESTSLADIKSINTSFGSIDSKSLNEAYSQTVSDLQSDMHSLESAANTTVSGGAEARIDAKHFTSIGLMADRDNATSQLAMAVAAAEKYDRGTADAIRAAYDRGGNVGADTFNALYAAKASGNVAEQMAATAALKAVYEYNQTPTSQAYAEMLEAQMDVLDHTQRLNKDTRSAMDAPVSAAKAESIGRFGSSIDTGSLNGIEGRIEQGRAASDDLGRNIRDHEKIMRYNMEARQKDMQEILEIQKQMRERAPTKKLADNLAGGGTEMLDELKKGNYEVLLEGAPGILVDGVRGYVVGQTASTLLGSQVGTDYESGVKFAMDPEVQSLLERKLALEERIKKYDPDDTTKTYDGTPVEKILGFTPSERQGGRRVSLGDGTEGGPSYNSTANTGAVGSTHTGMAKAADMVKQITGERFSKDPDKLIHTPDLKNKLLGYCANGTGLVLRKAGLIDDHKHGDAQQMGRSLQNHYGWKVVAEGTAHDRLGSIAGYTPRDGQVALIAPHGIGKKDGSGGDEHGHIAVWVQNVNGGKGAWVSDYWQGDRMIPNDKYVTAHSKITILESPKMQAHFTGKTVTPTHSSSGVAGSGFAAEVKSLMTKAEGNYNSVNFGSKLGGGIGTRDLSKMTVNEIVAAQKRDEFDAVGHFQMVPKTLAAGIKELKLTGKELFTPELQERFFNEYLINKAGGGHALSYIQGKHNDLDKAVLALSKEWAGFPVPYAMKGHVTNVKAGESYYKGHHGNKAHVSVNQVRNALIASREANLKRK